MISFSKTPLLFCIMLVLNASFFIEGSLVRGVSERSRELYPSCKSKDGKKSKKTTKKTKASKKCMYRRKLQDDELDEESFEFIYVNSDEDFYTLEYCDDYRDDGTGPCGADCGVDQFCCIQGYVEGDAVEDFVDYFCADEVEDGDNGADWTN